MLAVLAAAVVAALGLVTGLALAVAYALTSPDPSPADSGPARQPTADRGPSNGNTQQDALADEPMPSAGADDALPGPVSTRDPGVIELPRATGAGPAGVPTGFPRTPEGALAQLAEQPAERQAERQAAACTRPGGVAGRGLCSTATLRSLRHPGGQRGTRGKEGPAPA